MIVSISERRISLELTVTMELKYIDTGAYNPVLLCNNNLYTKRKTTHVGFDNETQYWYCRIRHCLGSLIIENGVPRHGAEHKPNCQQSEIAVEKLLFYDKLRKLCRSNVDAQFVQLYQSLKPEFPNAIQKIKFTDIRHKMFHWRYPDMQKLPETMLELDELMKIPHYYKEFGTLEVDSDGTFNELYAGTYEVDTIVKEMPIKSYFMAFKNSPIIRLLRERVLKLGGDGTFSIRPRKRKGSKQYFDDVQQVYSVHIIIERKFFIIGTFVLQHSTIDVMRKVFSLVNEWLNPNPQTTTTVESFMADYECASRVAVKEVWPTCKVLGCAVHFQRAVFKFGRDEGIYSDKTKVYERQLLAQVYGLCYLPEDNMKKAYEILEAQAIGDLEPFGKRLLHYLRTYWSNKNISVANEDVRVNNGSECFHWSVQRMHSWLRNNILDFVAFVRDIHMKSTTEFGQWVTIQSSKRQKQLEQTHLHIQDNLRINIQTLGEEKAVKKFFSDSLMLTKRARTFFDNIRSDLPFDEIDFTDLLIQEKTTQTPKSDGTSSTRIEMIAECSGIAQTLKLSNRSITFSSSEPIILGGGYDNSDVTAANLKFSHKSISNRHAEFRLINDSIYMRDLGTDAGTVVNGKRFGLAQIVADPLHINNNDILQFGDLTITVSLKTIERNERQKQKMSNTTATVHLTSEDIHTPERVIQLSNTDTTVIGRCRPTAPSSVDNGFFNNSSIAYKHAELWFTDNSLFINPIGPTYNVTTPLTKITRLEAPTMLTFGQINSSKSFSIHINAVHPTVTRMLPPSDDSLKTGQHACQICTDIEYQTNEQLQRHMNRMHPAPVSISVGQLPMDVDDAIPIDFIDDHLSIASKTDVDPMDVINDIVSMHAIKEQIEEHPTTRQPPATTLTHTVFPCPYCDNIEYATQEHLRRHLQRAHNTNA